MTPTAPAEFSREERQLVSTTLLERYGRVVAVEDVEVEIALAPEAAEPTPCPALYWNQRGAEFVVVKLGESRFRTQFFYADGEQFGTGRAEYDSLGDCVITVLQVQSDDERRRAAMGSGTRADAQVPEYDGPVVI